MATKTQAEKIYDRGVRVTAATTIQRDAMTLYAAWRTLSNLDMFVDDLVSVEEIDSVRSRWTVKGPAGTQFKWTAELIKDEMGRLLAWKTVEGADVLSAGTIRFNELSHNRGTAVRVTLEYVPPGGALGNAVAKPLNEDAQTKVRQALHRFRQVMECGEVPVSGGQPAGANSSRDDRPGEKGDRSGDPDVLAIAEGAAQ